jgi:hypothetical protein
VNVDVDNRRQNETYSKLARALRSLLRRTQ